MAQSHHLGQEFDIDHAPGALFDVELIRALIAKLAFDPLAHRRNLRYPGAGRP